MFVDRLHVDPASAFFALHPLNHHRGRPPMSLCKQSPRPWGTSLPASSPVQSRHTAAAALTDQNTTTMTRKSQRLTAAAGRLLTASHHHGSYLPGHAQPPTDIFSHVWCESDQNDGGGSVIPALFLSSSFSPVTAAATEAAHMSVCYPHGSYTHTHARTHTHVRTPPGSKEREGGESDAEGGKERKRGRKGYKKSTHTHTHKGSDSLSCSCTLWITPCVRLCVCGGVCYRVRRILLLPLLCPHPHQPCKLQLRWEDRGRKREGGNEKLSA